MCVIAAQLLVPRKQPSTSQWDYAGSDWASTLGVNPPYGGDDGHSTLPPGVSALDDLDDDDLPLGDVDLNDLKSSPEFRQQLLALHRMNNDADALARSNRTPKQKVPVKGWMLLWDRRYQVVSLSTNHLISLPFACAFYIRARDVAVCNRLC